MAEKHTTKFTPAAQRQMRGIPLPDARKILIKFAELQRALDEGDASGLDVKALTGRPGEWRLRIGDYRGVYTVENGELIVWVLAVGNRRDVYRDL